MQKRGSPAFRVAGGRRCRRSAVRMELSFEFKYRITGFANRCIHAIAPFQDVVNVHFMHAFPFGMKEGWHWRDRKSVREGGQGKDGWFFPVF